MGRRGAGLLEAVVAVAVGLFLLSAVGAALAAGARALVAAGGRAEASDTWLLAADALLFDVRRAGHDPAAGGVEAITLARGDRATFEADLDGDGAIDGASAERVSWVCNAAAARLSRVVGGQSMPMADGAVACGLAFLDETGAEMPLPAGGLDAAGRARAALVVLDLRLAPRGGAPAVARRLAVALRSRS